ncbi:hypothetical protein CALVIDRAFT_525803 [Calocera viscosa TUFC12733]|uniref:Uncharacterized protein n=1 Tax=Calocera viscosa (strain TUFC12733) TaxID=1330018 RepID=A0A167PI50_CALVF|nr:hypothetical protein CALVIDRAFT_525803 [Calocera viscosa TUFC12733]
MRPQLLPLPLLLTLLAFLDNVAGTGYDIAVEYDGQDVGYTGQWSVQGSPPNDTIFTATEGSAVQLTFSGTSIIVYGLLDPSALTSGYNFTLDNVPFANFSIPDNVTSPAPPSTPCDPYPLLNATSLPPGPHTLVVTNGYPSFEAYLAVKRFVYFDPDAPGPVPALSCSTGNKVTTGGVIAGSVVGGVAGVVLILLAVWGWRRQRRERGLAKQPPPYSERPLELEAQTDGA